MFDNDSMASYYFEQGLQSYLSGEDEESDIVRCKFCNRDGFHWEETEKGWRLATETGRLHICNKYRPAVLISEEI